MKRRGYAVLADKTYSGHALRNALMLKSVFHLTLRALQGFIDSVFQMMDVPLRCPDDTSISKRSGSVNVNIKTPTRGEIAHLVIDSTELKVFGEGELKVKKHGAESGRGASAADRQQQVMERENGLPVTETAMSRVKKVCGTADTTELRCTGG